MKKIIFSLIFATFLSVPVFSGAQTAPTQAQIRQQLVLVLQQTIAQLQAQITAISAQQPANTPSPVTLKGKLSLVQNSSFAGQTVIAPQLNFKLADFLLTNNTNEPINLNNIEVDLSLGANQYIANVYVTNLYVVYDNNKTDVINKISYKNSLTVNYQLQVGKTINLSVWGDISSSIPLNSSVSARVLVSGVTAISATGINTNSNTVLSGQNIIFGTGSLAVAQDGSTPAIKIFATNQKIIVGKFKFTSTGDSYTLSELKFAIPGANNVPAILDASLVDTATNTTLATVPATSNYNNNNLTFDFNVSIPVLVNSSKFITVYYDLGTTGNAQTTNINIAPVLVYVKAKSGAGTLIDGAATNYNNIAASYGGIAIPGSGVAVNSIIRAFKSFPTFTTGQFNPLAVNNSDINLYTFNIAANSNGDVSIKQLTFQIKITDPKNNTPYLNSFSLFKGGADYTSSVAIGNIVAGNYIGLKSDGGIGIGTTNNVVVNFAKEEIIPAGKTQTYTLKAHTNRFIKTSSISTIIPSDGKPLNSNNYLGAILLNIYDGLTQARADNLAVGYNLLWSDKSSQDHNDSSSSSSSDWYNGFGILNLPLSAQVETAK